MPYDRTIGDTLVADLKRDYGLSMKRASGVVANLAHETRGFKDMQEKGVKRGRGGLNLAQWTGPRRRALESYAAERNLDPASLEAGYGFMRQELASPQYARTLDRVRGATTPRQAAYAFEDEYEDAGTPHYDRRYALADEIAANQVPVPSRAPRGPAPVGAVQRRALPDLSPVAPTAFANAPVPTSAPRGMMTAYAKEAPVSGARQALADALLGRTSVPTPTSRALGMASAPRMSAPAERSQPRNVPAPTAAPRTSIPGQDRRTEFSGSVSSAGPSRPAQRTAASLPSYIGQPYNAAAPRMSQDSRLVGSPSIPAPTARPGVSSASPNLSTRVGTAPAIVSRGSAAPASYLSPNLSTRPGMMPAAPPVRAVDRDVMDPHMRERMSRPASGLVSPNLSTRVGTAPARPINVAGIPTSAATPNLSTRVGTAPVAPAARLNAFLGSPELAGQRPRTIDVSAIPASMATPNFSTRVGVSPSLPTSPAIPTPRPSLAPVTAAPVTATRPSVVPAQARVPAPKPTMAPVRNIPVPTPRPTQGIPDYVGPVDGLQRRAITPGSQLLGRLPAGAALGGGLGMYRGSMAGLERRGGVSAGSTLLGRVPAAPSTSPAGGAMRAFGGIGGLMGGAIGGLVGGPMGAMAGNLVGRQITANTPRQSMASTMRNYNGSTANLERRNSVSLGSTLLGRVQDDRRNQGNGGNAGGRSSSAQSSGSRSVGRNSADSSRGFGANGFSGNR